MQEYIQRGTTIGRGRMMAVTESGPGYGGVGVEMCKLFENSCTNSQTEQTNEARVIMWGTTQTRIQRIEPINSAFIDTKWTVDILDMFSISMML